MKKGQKMSAESRHKMSLAKKGKKLTYKRKMKPLSDEHRRKLSLAGMGRPGTMLGKKHSEETKAKMRLARVGRKPMLGKHHSAEARAKMSEAHKGNKNSLGFHPSDETREKFRQRMRGNRHLLGHKHTEETKSKIAEKSTGRLHTQEEKDKIAQAHRGPASHRWRGGKGPRKYGKGWKKAQREIRERDHHVCVLCFETNRTRKAIDVHHIIRIVVCNEKGLEPNLHPNLCCLCNIHHRWADDHPDKSIPQLQDLLSQRFGYFYYQGIPSQI